VRGEVRLFEEDAEPLVLGRGEAALVPASVGAYRAEGDADVYRAGVPM
jgi:hypothetical protein